MDELTKKLYELQKEIMQKVIDFCIENDVKPDIVHFGADGLTSSIEAGQWHPGTDSSLAIFDKDKNCIAFSL